MTSSTRTRTAPASGARRPGRHELLVLGTLAAAGICYLAGSGLASGLLLLAGALLELAFWILVFTGRTSGGRARR